MTESLLHFFELHPALALFISLGLSIIIAIAGIIPSYFITAANILFFGFWPGTLLSFMGEAFGAWIAFILYRKGLKKQISRKLAKYPRAQQLTEAAGWNAFWLVFSLRLIPFVPSGIVTFAAAIGKVSARMFLFSSSAGKIPALLIEAYAVYQVSQQSIIGKVILIAAAVAILLLVIRKMH